MNSIDETPNQENLSPVDKHSPTLPEASLADLPEHLQQGAIRAGWPQLMPVQAKAIPYLYSRRDMMIQSRTGSGKTGAYVLPLLDMINPLEKNTQALVLVPTRELATQVAHEAGILGSATQVHTTAIYGGVGYRQQLDALAQGAHLVVGTPGRILDHLLKRSLNLKNLKFLVFDEADRMLSMGFYPDMRRIQSYLPETDISTYMFSATFPAAVLRLTGQFMRQPGMLNLSTDHVHVAETEHIYYQVQGMDKDRSLVRIIEAENPLSAIIFCNTKDRVAYITAVLQRFGYDADDLTSDLAQNAREKVLERVRQGKLRFLVATDVAARGIDLPELSHVFQYEPPEDPEAYIHRAGRTGRAGGSGTAITLVNVLERPLLMRIARQFNVPLQEKAVPNDEDVQKIVSERVIALLEARLRDRDRLQIERMARFAPLVHSLGESEDESSLLTMLLDDFYQTTFHAPIVPPAEEKNISRPSGGRSGSGRRSANRRHGGPRY
ncbi:MAG TPA: DEAD/DEAH box helicase [Anaerolineaceae bacterium]|mgnify:CR=1 FL=1|nr:DEAD/DEAH box helicase [Anaerolineaceae bacterium]HPN52888.1 DEAD/DEAH box helicase [Anaerolineaceae bacterium]